jgi:hypothetical protein
MHGSTDSIDLKGIEDGKAPKSRLSDASKACEIVDTLVRANAVRAGAWAKVKGQLDGNPPFDQGALRRNAQANRTNVNFREAEGIHNSAVAPFYDLFAEAPYYAEVQCDHGNEADRIRYSKVQTGHFDRMLKEWDRFDFCVTKIINDRTGFGHGFAMWPDNESWRPDPVEFHRVLVPDGTNASIDEELDVIVVRQEYNLIRLWTHVMNPEAAKAAGWDRDATLRAMYHATPEGRGDASSKEGDFQLWCQQRLRNNDISESVRSKTVSAAHLLVREYDGKISHFIVPEKATPNTPGTSGAKDNNTKFLFERIGQYESFRQVLAAFFYDIGDGTWHSVKGLLVKLYPFVALKDRLNCATIDNAHMNMSLLLQAASKDALNDLQLLRVGSVSIIPPGLTVQQHQLIGRMEESLVVERHLDNKLQTNIGQYRKLPRREVGNPETATAEAIDAQKEAMLSKSAVNRWYAELDFFYEEIYRRASNPKLRPGTPANDAALAFQRRCVEDGVPKEAIGKVRSVRAFRNIGNGSIFMRQAAFQNSLALVPMFNEEGRNNWLDDAIGNLFSPEVIARYNPKPEQMTGVQEQANLAMIENGAIHDGINPIVAATQNHVVHADIHLKMASDAAASLMDGQGGDPMKVYSVLDIVGQHVLQHLSQFANDPTRQKQFKALEATWKKLAQFQTQLEGQIRQMVQQQQAQAQQQQQMMTDEQMKQAKVQNDIERRTAKDAQSMEQKQRKADQALAINARAAQQAEAIADITTAADLKRQQEKADAQAEAAKKAPNKS